MHPEDWPDIHHMPEPPDLPSRSLIAIVAFLAGTLAGVATTLYMLSLHFLER